MVVCDGGEKTEKLHFSLFKWIMSHLASVKAPNLSNSLRLSRQRFANEEKAMGNKINVLSKPECGMDIVFIFIPFGVDSGHFCFLPHFFHYF